MVLEPTSRPSTRTRQSVPSPVAPVKRASPVIGRARRAPTAPAATRRRPRSRPRPEAPAVPTAARSSGAHLPDGTVEELQDAGGGVEADAGAVGEGAVAGAVADRGAAHHR